MSTRSIEYDDNSPFTVSELELSVKPKNSRSLCAICGAIASGLNFNVITCISCKAFFRRNGLRRLDLINCHSSGTCEIDQYTRRRCTACRLRRCLAMGMNKQRIRTDEQNQHYRDLVAENRLKRLDKGQTSRNNDSKRTRRMHDNDINKLYDLFILIAKKNIPKDFLFEFDFDLTKTLNLYCIPTSCLITFIKQISYFQCLPIDDRLVLLKNNTKVLLPILAGLFSLTFDIPFRVKHQGYNNLNEKIVDSCLLMSHFIHDDTKLLLFIIIIFLFCPCLLTNRSLITAGCISNESYRLIKIAYDKYAQMLWDYITQKSLNNEQQTRLKCMKIVTKILYLQKLTSEIYDLMDGEIRVEKVHMMIQSILHLN